MPRRTLFAAFLSVLASAHAAPGAVVQVLIVTGSESFCAEAHAAAARLAAKEPSASNRSGYRHLVLEDSSFLDPSSLKKTISGFANDPRVKGIVVSPSPSGTAAGFKAAREIREDILCAAVNPAEAPLLIEANADLVVGTDTVGRALRLARLARQCGVKRILFLPENPPFSAEENARFDAVLAAACAESGVELSVKPPKESADSFLNKSAEAGSPKSLLWSATTLDSAILRSFLDAGNYILDSPKARLASDYAELLAQDPLADSGDYQKILKRYEKAAIDAGYAGRLGTWIFPEAYVLTSGVSEFIRKNPGKKISSRDAKPLLQEIQRFCPGTKPTLAQRVDPDTGVKARNHFRFTEEIYVLGRGFLSQSPSGIPDTYQLIKP